MKPLLARTYRRSLATIVVSALLSSCSSPTQLGNVERLSPLSVQGSKIVNADGVAVSLAGPSLFWSNDGWDADRFYNAEAVKTVAEDWGADIIRAAIGVEGKGGYLESPESNYEKATTVIDAAIANGLYVLVDWHSHHAEDHPEEAIAFFDRISKRYGESPNVIYEIYNEPLRVSWSDVVKPYALRVIAAIRKNDPDNLIIVGTPFWSQRVDEASVDPITEYENIAYTLHFYAGTHREELRDRARTALKNGIALMVTEWGTVNANGDGGVDYAETERWMDFIRENDLSHCNWALNDKREGASMLKPGASSTGPWPEDQLTESGKLVVDLIENWGD